MTSDGSRPSMANQVGWAQLRVLARAYVGAPGINRLILPGWRFVLVVLAFVFADSFSLTRFWTAVLVIVSMLAALPTLLGCVLFVAACKRGSKHEWWTLETDQGTAVLVAIQHPNEAVELSMFGSWPHGKGLGTALGLHVVEHYYANLGRQVRAEAVPELATVYCEASALEDIGPKWRGRLRKLQTPAPQSARAVPDV